MAEHDVVELKHILEFYSGADQEPPLGFPSKPILNFCEGKLATASTCSLLLQLPLANETYEKFKYHMTLSLVGNSGFGVV